MTSLCEYIRNPSSNKINYFKVNKSIIASQITAYIRNSIESTPDCLLKLEEEFKQEIWRQTKAALLKKKQPTSDDESAQGDDESQDLEVIPADILVTEKVNAKLF